MNVLTYERELLKKERRKNEMIPLPLLSLGLFLADRRKAHRGKSIEEARYDDLLLRRPEELCYQEARTAAGILLLLLGGLLLTGLIFFARRGPDGVSRLARPGFGTENTVPLKVRIGEEEESILVTVSGRDPEGEALEAALDRAFEALKTEGLGRNASWDSVTDHLNFRTEHDAGIRLSYRSSDPELLSDRGIVLAEEIPEEGLPLEIHVTLSYGGAEKEYCLPVTLRKREEALTPVEEVERAVRRANEEGRDREELILPDQAGEHPISFRQDRTSPWIALGICLAAAVLLYFLPKEKEKEKKKQREEELRLSYPQLLSKLDTLIHAGMSIRSAWSRIVKEYRDERAAGERKREYAYEEMWLTLLRLERGENEGEAYEEFGKRCTLRCYRKLGNLLGQNLRQGIAGLEGALEEEMEKALEERKTRALRAGEEAGTKLLFPMVLMLGIVVVTLVVPAFLSF